MDEFQKCPQCGNRLEMLPRATRNLESYHPNGGQIVTATLCCGRGIVLKSKIVFSAEAYTGKDREDAWGEKIRK